MRSSQVQLSEPAIARVTTHLDEVEALLQAPTIAQGQLPSGERTLLLKGLAGLRKHLIHPLFRCPVFGITKAGKSTLINALLRQELLASSNVPVTRVAIDLVHNPSLDSPELIGPDGALRHGEAIKERLIDLEAPVSGELSPWRLEVSMPFLHDIPGCELRFTLVDTPGVTEAGGSILSKSTLHQIARADAAVLLMNSQDLHTLGEQVFLKQVASKRPDLFLRPNRTFFFAVSKVDIRNRSSAPFGQVAQLIGEQLRSALPNSITLANPWFIPVKCELALLARVATLPEAGEALRMDYTRNLFGAAEHRPRSALFLQRHAAVSVKSSGILQLEEVLRSLAKDMVWTRSQTISMRLHHLVNRATRMARIHHAVKLETALQALKEHIRYEALSPQFRS